MFEKATGAAALDPEPEEGDEPADKPRPTEVLDLEPKAVEESDEEGPGTPLSAEELKRLLEAGAVLKVGRSTDTVESAGIFARDVFFGTAACFFGRQAFSGRSCGPTCRKRLAFSKELPHAQAPILPQVPGACDAC